MNFPWEPCDSADGLCWLRTLFTEHGENMELVTLFIIVFMLLICDLFFSHILSRSRKCSGGSNTMNYGSVPYCRTVSQHGRWLRPETDPRKWKAAIIQVANHTCASSAMIFNKIWEATPSWLSELAYKNLTSWLNFHKAPCLTGLEE